MRLLFFMLFTMVIACGCKQGNQNVTKDPAYKFATMAGTMWRLKTPIALEHINPTDVGWGRVCSEDYAREFAAGKADPKKFAFSIVGIVPSGTTFQINGLRTGDAEMGGVFVIITFQNGKYKGNVIEAPEELFLPNDYLTPGKSCPRTWAVNPENLEQP